MPDRVPRSRNADRVKCRSQQMIAAGHAGGGRGGRSPLRLTDSDSPGARALFKGGSVTMKPIEMGIVGVGWIGEIRAKVCAGHPLIKGLHLCEIDKARLERVAKETGARTATTDYRELLARSDIDAIIVSTTPETTHYPFTRDCLMARKHVLLEKPIGLELKHADELMQLALAHRLMVTMDDGTAFTIGAGWALPPGYPHFSSATIEFIATEGAVLVDDSHRDVILNTMKNRMVLPLSTMPGEQVGHVYQGPMAAETIHFIEAVAGDRPVLVTPEEARLVMEVTLAADLSAERNAPVSLPLD